MIKRDHPQAAASLREGLQETFTINRHDVPPSLHRCLATTNIIESPQAGVWKKTGNVCRWRDGDMILRWVAGAFLLTEKKFRKIMGYQDLWTLAGILGRTNTAAASQKEKWPKMNSTRRPNLQLRLGHPRHVCDARLSAGGVADHFVTQMLSQGDSQVFKRYSQAKLNMMREALSQLDR